MADYTRPDMTDEHIDKLTQRDLVEYIRKLEARLICVEDKLSAIEGSAHRLRRKLQQVGWFEIDENRFEWIGPL